MLVGIEFVGKNGCSIEDWANAIRLYEIHYIWDGANAIRPYEIHYIWDGANAIRPYEIHYIWHYQTSRSHKSG